jgi:hypothetical protein
MPMDPLKAAVAKAITEFVNSEDFHDHIFDRDDPPAVVEVHDVTPLENMIRVYSNVGGAPRYFLVKVSESI